MTNVPHPDGGGRQQPNPDDYTITAARIASAAGDAVVLMTEEAAAVLISRADTPALFDKFIAWAQAPGNTADAYTPPPPVEPPMTETDVIKAALIAKGTLTEADIDAARTTLPDRKG